MMQFIVKANIVAYGVLMVARSPIGQVTLIIALIVFDASVNTIAISQLFADRIITLDALVGGAGDAQALGVRFGAIASVCLGFGIFIMALIVQTQKDEKGKELKNEQGEPLYFSHKSSKVLAYTSFLMSLVGFVMLVAPQGAQNFSFLQEPIFIIKVAFSVVLAGFSPYLTYQVSHNLAHSDPDTFLEVNQYVTAYTRETIREQLQAMKKVKAAVKVQLPFKQAA